ncbi:hypothetical protein IG193_08505 [Infirmifilum lucidum]|uniref:Uncharacterized protein n=1 Tax=Infirmifilum lucidum TaxID=2776706 RepID=A0A7L9FIM5_9CREN|nr:hypothetical protein [Infirmifilum lucidum]QOJ78774.1 hypothetical protein IG193_08505 [Infirmifilum lucidum]
MPAAPTSPPKQVLNAASLLSPGFPLSFLSSSSSPVATVPGLTLESSSPENFKAWGTDGASGAIDLAVIAARYAVVRLEHDGFLSVETPEPGTMPRRP